MVDLTMQDNLQSEGYSCYAGTPGVDIPTGTAWYTFVATDDTATVQTCNSVGSGRDSVVALYEGGCCAPVPLAEVACADDTCGFTDFLSRFCAEGLTVGTTYFIQISNWNENVNGLYTLEVACPCTGACCNPLTAVCQDGVAQADCPATSQFVLGGDCASFDPPCGQDACCSAAGTCTDTNAAGCSGCGDGTCDVGFNHLVGVVCADVLCNVSDTCVYATYPNLPTAPPGSFGFRSQYSPDTDQWLQFADSFNLKGNPGNTCLISEIGF
jgi:hypothetical protein